MSAWRADVDESDGERSHVPLTIVSGDLHAPSVTAFERKGAVRRTVEIVSSAIFSNVEQAHFASEHDDPEFANHRVLFGQLNEVRTFHFAWIDVDVDASGLLANASLRMFGYDWTDEPEEIYTVNLLDKNL